MKLIDYIILGFRNIWRRKSRSFLTIFAVTIGAISIIIMMSLVLGAREVATQQLESIDGLTLISVSPNPELQSNGDLLNPNQNFDETGQKLNDTHVAQLKQLPHVVDAAPLVNVWVKSLKLEGQDKKFNANIVSYDPNSKVLSIPVTYGRPLQAGDLDKVVVGTEMLRNYGYQSHPQDIIGKKLILYAQDFVDWGADPPKPPLEADKSYYENLSKQPHEITAEIIGVSTNGPNEGQNYITLEWGRRLMTSRRWEWNESTKRVYDQQKQMTNEQSGDIQRLKEEMQQKIDTMQQRMMEAGFKVEQIDAKVQEIKGQYEEMINNITRSINSNPVANDQANVSEMLVLVKDDQIARNGYGSILVRVDATENLEEVGSSIKKLGYGVSTAKEMLDQIKNIFNLIGLIIGAIGGIVLFVAALGIINNMIMATYERTREIGILRACGATRSNIRNMFIFEAAALGFIGGLVGLGISVILAKVLNNIGNGIAASNGIPINNLISFQPWLVIGVIAVTTLIGTISGLLPAIRASYLDPVEALRYE